MISVDPQRMRCLIWLASYPRSGNTWTRALIKGLYHLGLGQPLDRVNINRLGGTTDALMRYYKPFLGSQLPPFAKSTVAAIRPRAIRRIIEEARGGAQLVKTHNARVSHLGVPFIDPALTAGAVYIVRNPLDVAVSVSAFLGVSLDQAIVDMATPGFETPGDQAFAYGVFDSWSGNVRSWTERPDPSTLVVRYEDLFEKPEPVVLAMARHLQMDPTPTQVARIVDLCAFDRLKEEERSGGFVERPMTAREFFRAGRAGQWRDVLSSTQVDRITRAHEYQMKRFGYLP
jgi:hypothetical protein